MAGGGGTQGLCGSCATFMSRNNDMSNECVAMVVDGDCESFVSPLILAILQHMKSSNPQFGCKLQ